MSPAIIVNKLREETLVTSANVEKIQKDFYRKSGKSARKGGLAGNIIEPVLWRKHAGKEKGKILNALLKISAAEKGDLRGEVEFLEQNELKIPFPEVLYWNGPFYCMEKIPLQNFSDFIFEQIGFAQTNRLLEKVLAEILTWHRRSNVVEAEPSLVLNYVEKIRRRLGEWVDHNKFFEALIFPKTLMINNLQYFNALYLCQSIEESYDPVKQSIEPKGKMKIHGDVVAQNIFIDNENDNIRVIDPRAEETDYLVDYYKLFSSFSGQGHLEYLTKNPQSRCAHVYVNEGLDPNACYYVCSPSLENMRKSQRIILKHIKNNQRGVYTQLEAKSNNWINRFLLGLATQYLGAPPFRDSEKFHDEMKFLYYRGVEILNEFCERMNIIKHRRRIFERR